jgi:hypothetical protein
MEIKKKITISLSENDVKAIVAEYLTKNGYKVKVEDITLDVGNEWIGYGRDEHQEPRFRECRAVVREV